MRSLSRLSRGELALNRSIAVVKKRWIDASQLEVPGQESFIKSARHPKISYPYPKRRNDFFFIVVRACLVLVPASHYLQITGMSEAIHRAPCAIINGRKDTSLSHKL